jgi:hypothetical protein|tara:strand:- start:2097 stop:2303 length:207 start_codon:yes stop_codon:yes gene_type:complete
MDENFIVPVVVRNADGSCLVAFPDGTRLAAIGLEGAQEIVNHFYGEEEEEDAPRRIGFRVPEVEAVAS